MERNEIVKNIQGALTEVLMRDFGPLPESTRLFEDMHLDSTAILELLMALEDNIGIEVDPEKLDMDDFRTIGTLTDFLERTPKVTS
ncbi:MULTISPECIES: acyl carrier protein [unclassified Micromonospora]|uniref:acyl carrier protein n=1 Tax=unclassified Micromonospora TaxID=2617518 RepID=UPI0010470060|nr:MULTISPECIES: phosphopantetheine-binding protein [unclassified Micromonospora]TDB82790.1 acyl carrier protein [Micromonospora sp. KC721]TDC41580.1 acyl carrier protein [Micromonospora sp. KC213]